MGKVKCRAEKVDSTFAEIGSIETLVAQSDGSYVTNTVQGLNLYINATPPAGQDYYYKVNSTDIQQYTQVYYPDTTGRAEGSKLIGRYSQGNMVPEILYGWYSNSITLDKDLKAGTAEFAVPIKNLYIGFLPQFISFQNDTFTDAPISAGAVTITSIYSVSNKIYQIFTEENSQTVPDNTLFDPIPTQLGTNIKCTSDTTQSVLGYFCAASIVRSYHFFLWAEGEKNIFSYKIDSLPVIPPAGIDTSYSPSFWFFTNGEAK